MIDSSGVDLIRKRLLNKVRSAEQSEHITDKELVYQLKELDNWLLKVNFPLRKIKEVVRSGRYPDKKCILCIKCNNIKTKYYLVALFQFNGYTESNDTNMPTSLWVKFE